MVPAMAKAAIAAGADGLIIEVHNDPPHALCDGAQSILPSDFDTLMQELRPLAQCLGRKALMAQKKGGPWWWGLD